MIRPAEHRDLAALCDLYNALIPTTTIAWTESPQTLDERERWFEHQRSHDFPVLVATSEDLVVGFTAYADFRGAGKWVGYRHTVEHTIHVAQTHWGRGVGRQLLQALIAEAEAAGVHVMIAAIDADNAESIVFHQKLGFTVTARMPQVGTKFGRWLDLVLMQRQLDNRLPQER